MKKIAKNYKDIGNKVLEDNVTITTYKGDNFADYTLSFKKQNISIALSRKDIKELLLVSSAVRKDIGIKLDNEDKEMLAEEIGLL